MVPRGAGGGVAVLRVLRGLELGLAQLTVAHGAHRLRREPHCCDPRIGAPQVAHLEVRFGAAGFGASSPEVTLSSEILSLDSPDGQRGARRR